ncbi:MAG: LysR family transcriptional regulator [Sphingomonas sp.]|nr:LysR family transcriptional regulator [Sphingomonas sp.]
MAQFVRVVEAGSFSAAARVLGQGQPAVSKAVAQLEARLGLRLLTRTTRALTLTDAGRAYYDRARLALDAAEEAEAAARGAAAALTGRLRVCAPVTFARLHIVPALAGFRAAHPALDVDLVLDDRRIDLVQEGIDVAIRAGDMPDSSMVATRLAEGVRRVVAAPAYWHARAPVEDPADLAALDFIAYGPGPGGLDWIFSQGGATRHVRMTSRLRMSALEGVREAVFAGLGFAIMSQWAADDAIAAGTARALLPDYSLPSVDLWAVYPAGRQPPARARLFADFVQRCVNRSHPAGTPFR